MGQEAYAFVNASRADTSTHATLHASARNLMGFDPLSIVGCGMKCHKALYLATHKCGTKCHKAMNMTAKAIEKVQKMKNAFHNLTDALTVEHRDSDEKNESASHHRVWETATFNKK